MAQIYENPPPPKWKHISHYLFRPRYQSPRTDQTQSILNSTINPHRFVFRLFYCVDGRFEHFRAEQLSTGMQTGTFSEKSLRKFYTQIWILKAGYWGSPLYTSLSDPDLCTGFSICIFRKSARMPSSGHHIGLHAKFHPRSQIPSSGLFYSGPIWGINPFMGLVQLGGFIGAIFHRLSSVLLSLYTILYIF